MNDKSPKDHIWLGSSSDSIAGDANPTLSLIPGQVYTVEWTDATGGKKDFVSADAEGDVVVSNDAVTNQGATQSIEFTATDEMTENTASVADQQS